MGNRTEDLWRRLASAFSGSCFTVHLTWVPRPLRGFYDGSFYFYRKNNSEISQVDCQNDTHGGVTDGRWKKLEYPALRPRWVTFPTGDLGPRFNPLREGRRCVWMPKEAYLILRLSRAGFSSMGHDTLFFPQVLSESVPWEGWDNLVQDDLCHTRSIFLKETKWQPI